MEQVSPPGMKVVLFLGPYLFLTPLLPNFKLVAMKLFSTPYSPQVKGIRETRGNKRFV